MMIEFVNIFHSSAFGDVLNRGISLGVLADSRRICDGYLYRVPGSGMAAAHV